MGTIKDRSGRDLVDTEEVKKRWKEYMEKLYKKNILMNQITMMVWLVTQSQTFWSTKSSGPYKVLLLIKLVDVMKFQNSSNP